MKNLWLFPCLTALAVAGAVGCEEGADKSLLTKYNLSKFLTPTPGTKGTPAAAKQPTPEANESPSGLVQAPTPTPSSAVWPESLKLTAPEANSNASGDEVKLSATAPVAFSPALTGFSLACSLDLQTWQPCEEGKTSFGSLPGWQAMPAGEQAMLYVKDAAPAAKTKKLAATFVKLNSAPVFALEGAAKDAKPAIPVVFSPDLETASAAMQLFASGAMPVLLAGKSIGLAQPLQVTDPDGDAVKLRYEWLIESPAAGSNTFVALGAATRTPTLLESQAQDVFKKIKLRVTAQDAAGAESRLESPALVLRSPQESLAVLADLPKSVSNVTALDVGVSGMNVLEYAFALVPTPATLSASPCAQNTYSAFRPVSERIKPNVISDGLWTLCVLGKDRAGTVQSQPTVFSWRRATQAPVATLSNTPATTTNTMNFQVTVGGNGAVEYTAQVLSGSDCSLATTFSWSPISQLLTMSTGSSDGPKVLCVKTRDAAGNVQATWTSFAYTKDSNPPVASLLSSIAGAATDLNVTVGPAGDAVEYRYALTTAANCTGVTYGAWTPVATPITDNLGVDGSKRLCILARDAMGNTQQSPTQVAWTKDTVVPANATLSGTPSLVSSVTALNVTVSSASADATEYSASLVSATDCTTAAFTTWNPLLQAITLATGIDGQKTLCVKVRDAAGNTQATPTAYSWLKDTVAPTATLSGLPAVNATTLNVTVGSSGDAAEYRYALTTAANCTSVTYGSWTAVSTAITGSLGADGSKRLCVQARDAALNAQSTTTESAWTKDSTPPSAAITALNGAAVYSSNQLNVTMSGTCSTDAVTLSAALSGVAQSAPTNNCASNGTWSLAVTFTAQGSVAFQLTASDSNGNSVSVSQNITYDTMAPSAVSFSSILPAATHPIRTPALTGTAESGSTVKIYTTNNCSGTAVATGSAENFASPGLTVSAVSQFSTTTYYATATDLAGNASTCAGSVTFTHASVPLLVKDIETGNGDGSNVGAKLLIGTKMYFSGTNGSKTGLWFYDTVGATFTFLKSFTNGPNNLTNWNGVLYFTADEGNSGHELWKSDGTAAGTVLVKDINPGPDNSNPGYLTPLNASTLVFSAYDNSTGSELWKTDGTTAGTVQVKDIYSGSSGSNPSYMVAFGGAAYFAGTDTTYSNELWKTDGTAAGTVVVKDIYPGGGSAGSWLQNLTVLNGAMYFRATDGTNGYEPWKSDGTAAGTVLLKDIFVGSGSSNPWYFVYAGGSVYFAASDAASGNELWKSDGTTAGTVLVKDINAGATNSSPTSLTAMGNEVYFAATTTTAGNEIWKSDGTSAGTLMLADINSGTNNSTPSNMAVLGSTLLFSAYSGTYGWETWKTDGTTSGTVLLKDIYSGSNSSSPSSLYTASGRVYFSATDGTNGAEMWQTDGTSTGTTMVFSNNSASSLVATNYRVAYNDKLVFKAFQTGSGSEMWISDGTSTGTTIVKEMIAGAGQTNLDNFTVFNNKVFFSAWSSGSGIELWSSDGTTAGTTLFKELYAGANGGSPGNLTAINNKLYFSATEGTYGGEIWTSDGTVAGTTLLVDMNSGGADHWPSRFTLVGSTIFYTGTGAGIGEELYKTDGTAAGTAFVADIYSGAPGGSIKSLTAFGNKLIFQASSMATGLEAYISDGTTAGTTALKDICQTGPMHGYADNFTVIGTTVYFSASDCVNGQELWKSDGTTAGTVMVKDILSGVGGSNPRNFMVIGSTLYFVASDGTNGVELWKSDGTAAGTVMVKDIATGAAGSNPQNLTKLGSHIYFSADDGTNGNELWRTDGSAAGTVLVANINTSGDSSPSHFQVVGYKLFFYATNGASGREPFVYDTNP